MELWSTSAVMRYAGWPSTPSSRILTCVWSEAVKRSKRNKAMLKLYLDPLHAGCGPDDDVCGACDTPALPSARGTPRQQARSAARRTVGSVRGGEEFVQERTRKLRRPLRGAAVVEQRIVYIEHETFLPRPRRLQRHARLHRHAPRQLGDVLGPLAHAQLRRSRCGRSSAHSARPQACHTHAPPRRARPLGRPEPLVPLLLRRPLHTAPPRACPSS
jgi:hypothetical protein